MFNATVMEELQSRQNYCAVCGHVDSHYDENAIEHFRSSKHISNVILDIYKRNKKSLSSNRDGVSVFCSAESLIFEDTPGTKLEKCSHQKIRIYAKPRQHVKFSFEVNNDTKKDVLVVGVQLAHPQPQFQMNKHPYIFGQKPQVLKTKSSILNEVWVTFKAADMGQYEMPIVLTFQTIGSLEDKTSKNQKKISGNIIIVREMVVMVQENPIALPYPKSPYVNKDFKRCERYIQSTDHMPVQTHFKIPKLLKIILPLNFKDDALEKLKVSDELKAQLGEVLIATRVYFDEGITKENYMIYFHHLLWWEEIIVKINLKRYNMHGVTIERREDETYWLEVPGLSEKRPSLLRGDQVLIRPQEDETILFESIVEKLNENTVLLSKIDESFEEYYRPDALFGIRFLMSRVPMERMHHAVSRVFISNKECCVFPQPNKKKVTVKPILQFYNKMIGNNEEQRSAVNHIVSKTSGKAPYIVFGPPGTGKTMTIVEAIIQIVVKNPKNRVLVCTDSNMAADHIAVMLLRFNKTLNINHFILRASSQCREWTILPSELESVSNGTSYETFFSVTNDHASMYRIMVTTLLHAAKYASAKSQSHHKLQMSHLFIDEAAQALEPAALVPITGLLAPDGQLVLAGDPKQLGPVCISREASNRGLGISLLQRLWQTYTNLYGNDDPKYITTLVKNFRSHPDILRISNELFYKGKLQPQAKLDPLSEASILPGMKGGRKAIVFHAVNSMEQRLKSAPSYFNHLELIMLQNHVNALTTAPHNVSPKDIGIIAPYIRQVYKMKEWLKDQNFEDIEIGTVESFQGKEKRVILVSTVRANCKLLDYDAKYDLGFLVDDKRFNVTLTRAKAKLVIIGNPTCLTRDEKWRKYMNLCKEYDSYFALESQQLDRTAALLADVSQTRFERCYLLEALKMAEKKYEEEKKQPKNGRKGENNKKK